MNRLHINEAATDLSAKVRQLKLQMEELKTRQFTSQKSGVTYYTSSNNQEIGVVVNGGPLQHGTKVTIPSTSSLDVFDFSIVSTFYPNIHRPALAHIANTLRAVNGSDDLLVRMGLDTVNNGTSTSVYTVLGNEFSKVYRAADIQDDRNISNFGTAVGGPGNKGGDVWVDAGNTNPTELTLSTVVRSSDRGSIDTVLYLFNAPAGVVVT